VRQQQASIGNLRGPLTMQASLMKQAGADLTAKKAADFAGIDAERYRNLAYRSTGTEQNAQMTLMADAQAKAAVEASNAGLMAARQQTDVLGTQIEQTESALDGVRLDAETANL
jgi:membrane fusion protein (multidrug efflux system)